MTSVMLPNRGRTFKKQKTRHNSTADSSGDVLMPDANFLPHSSSSAANQAPSISSFFQPSRKTFVKLLSEETRLRNERRDAVLEMAEQIDPRFLASFAEDNKRELYKQRRQAMGKNSAETMSPAEYRAYRRRNPDLAPPRTPAVDAFREKINKLGGPLITFVNEVDDEDPPLHFDLVNDFRFADEVRHLMLNPDFMVSCECEKCGDDCACVDEEIPYDDQGRMLQPLHSRIRHVDAVTECSTFCTCFEDCKNVVVTKGRRVPLEIFKTTDRGWGLRSPINLKAGTFIECYFGDLIPRDERAGYYLFDLDFFDEVQPQAPRLTIDGEKCGSVTRFMNNSCDPNCRCVPICPSEVSAQMGWYYLALFTCKDVPAFTELTFRYAGHAEKMIKRDPSEIEENNVCKCGARNCCGYLWY